MRLFGKGSKQRIVPVGSYARAALDAYLVRARPLLSVRGRSTPALFLGMRGRACLAPERLARHPGGRRAREARDRDLAAQLPALLRDPPARRAVPTCASCRSCSGTRSVATTQIYTLVTADTLRDMYTTAHPRAR